MSRFDRILIALELGDEDDSTLAFANRLLKLFEPERVDVAHIVDTRLLPDALMEGYPALLNGSRRRREQRLVERLHAGLSLPDDSVLHRHVRVGAPLYELLDLSLEHEADLIITGRNRTGHRVETLPVRLARKAPCPVLVVPEGSRVRIQKILVPLDFSPHSAHALEVAGGLADRTLARQLLGLHAFGLPPGIRDSDRSEEEFTAIMKTYATRAFNRFIEAQPEPPVPLEMTYVLDDHPARAVLQAATPEACDLVVLGARGEGVPGQALLGRVAARVIHSAQVPVLVTRRRKASQRTLQAVMGLLGETG